MSRDAYRAHYEDRHVPLALEWFGFDKYVRNHVVAGEPGFDCVAEFWPHDPEQVARAGVAAGQIFAEDDALFMRDERRAGAVDETHLAGPARDFDAPGTPKTVLLVEGGKTDAAVSAWAAGEVSADRAARITADVPRPNGGTLGDTLVLHVWTTANALQPPPRTVVSRAETLVFDTPSAVLEAARSRLKTS